MQQLSLFDDLESFAEKSIMKIDCGLFSYEVGKGDVTKIELSIHGSEKLDIYRIMTAEGELIVHAGMLVPYQIEGVGGMKIDDYTRKEKDQALDEAWEIMKPSIEPLKTMITDYKNQGFRVDEVLFQEVTNVVDRAKKAENLLQKLFYEMGKGPDEDVGLWMEVSSHVKNGEQK